MGLAALSLVLFGGVAVLGTAAWSVSDPPALPDPFVPPDYAIAGTSGVMSGEFAVVWTQLDRPEAVVAAEAAPKPDAPSSTWRLLMVSVDERNPVQSTAIVANDALGVEGVVRVNDSTPGNPGLRVRAIEILGWGDTRQGIVTLIDSHGAVQHLILSRTPKGLHRD